MMKMWMRSALAVGVIAALPAAVLAQQAVELASALPGDAGTPGAVQAGDPAVERLLASAEQSRRSGELGVAVRQLEEVAKLQRGNGSNAADTYWKIAEIHNANGRFSRTGLALDRAASEAARFGNVDLQVRALFEAAVAYSAGGQVSRAAQRVRRVQGLLDQPGVSPGVRDQIRRKMGEA